MTRFQLRFCLCGILSAIVPGLFAPRALAVPAAPAGYFVNSFVTVGTPTALTFGGDGWLYVARLSGQVMAIRDLDGNGAADTTVTFASGLVWPLGLTWHDGSLYVTSLTHLTRFTDQTGDHRSDLTETLVDTIPSGLHWTTGVATGPDGRLYVGVGSEFARDVNPHPWQSSVLRFTTAGQFVDIFATGFRNPYDLAFHADGSLFATDNGPPPDASWNCDEAPDELNWVRAGHDYGFPFCFGGGDCRDVSGFCSPVPCGPGDCQWQTGCAPGLTGPVLNLEAHSSSDGLAFGAGFRGFGGDDLFIAQYGQNELVPGCVTDFGHKVVRVALHRSGDDWSADPAVDFVTGLKHPLDVTVGPDSALYIADFGNYTVYRVSTTLPGAVPDGGLPSPAGRMAVWPNPASRRATLDWEGPADLTARLVIFDVAGRNVADLGTVRGAASRAWDLRDAAGRRVPPGLYFARAATRRGVVTGRFAVTG